jgi:hypothetical protein
LPIHATLFADDFKMYENRDLSGGVCIMTLANVHHGLRGNRNSPAVAPLMFWDSNAKEEHGYDAFIDEITPELWQLAKGVVTWNVHYQCTVFVILLIHLVTGDGPGRSVFGQFIFTRSG